MALDVIRRDEDIDVVALLVTMNAAADRVAMHAVRRALVEAQADRLGLALNVIESSEFRSFEVWVRTDCSRSLLVAVPAGLLARS